MTFGDNSPNYVGDSLHCLNNEATLPCWRRISEFIFKAEHKQFKKIIGKFRKREIHEMKNNIKRSQQVFKKIVMKNRRFARLFQKVVKHTYSQVGISNEKEISDEMRHKISEILKESLNMKIQDVKRKIKNNKRIAAIRRRTRRQNSDIEDSKSVTSEDPEDYKQLAGLQPFFEQSELQNIPTIKECIKLEEDNQNSNYDFQITEKSSSSSYTSSSSISSLEKKDVHLSNRELLLQLTRRRKQSLPKKSRFV
ncbi:unnamed protein product [Moneuplotes crassus]|uniref:Uncharacterized protein n=1 Tax=Euplotes crassus TaxID=5936 RepID=A0AAD1Y8C1_EUPCR|nr:unnamed protein product [Moneuplotes crassus]